MSVLHLLLGPLSLVAPAQDRGQEPPTLGELSAVSSSARERLRSGEWEALLHDLDALEGRSTDGSPGFEVGDTPPTAGRILFDWFAARDRIRARELLEGPRAALDELERDGPEPRGGADGSRGELLLLLGSEAEALACWRATVESQPSSPAADRLGLQLARRGEWAETLRCWSAKGPPTATCGLSAASEREDSNRELRAKRLLCLVELGRPIDAWVELVPRLLDPERAEPFELVLAVRAAEGIGALDDLDVRFRDLEESRPERSFVLAATELLRWTRLGAFRPHLARLAEPGPSEAHGDALRQLALDLLRAHPIPAGIAARERLAGGRDELAALAALATIADPDALSLLRVRIDARERPEDLASLLHLLSALPGAEADETLRALTRGEREPHRSSARRALARRREIDEGWWPAANPVRASELW